MSWDMVDDLSSRLGLELNVQPRYGKDLKAIDAALADLFPKVAVDPARVGIMGFSDGAAYALSVGTASTEGHSVGTEWGRTGRCRWSTDHEQKKKPTSNIKQ